MSTARRTALVSLIAALVLVVVKLAVGLASGSLGVLAEAAHSGIDAVSAVLTLYAVGVAERPADREHPYGHGKAQHLAALGEAVFLSGAAVWIAVEAVLRLHSGSSPVNPRPYVFAVILFVLVIDATRTTVSLRQGRQAAKRGADRKRLALRVGLRRHGGGARRPRPGRGGRARRRLGRRDLRGGDRAGRRRAAGPRQRRRAHGPGAVGPGRRWSSGSCAASSASPRCARCACARRAARASPTSSSASRGSRGSRRPTRPPTGSSRRCATRSGGRRCRCTSSRPRSPRSAPTSGSPPRRCACPEWSRRTTSPCSRTPPGARSRCTCACPRTPPCARRREAVERLKREILAEVGIARVYAHVEPSAPDAQPAHDVSATEPDVRGGRRPRCARWPGRRARWSSTGRAGGCWSSRRCRPTPARPSATRTRSRAGSRTRCATALDAVDDVIVEVH